MARSQLCAFGLTEKFASMSSPRLWCSSMQ